MKKCPKCGNTSQFIQFQIVETRQDVVVDGYGNIKFIKEIYNTKTTDSNILECSNCGFDGNINLFEVENEEMS